ncbi:hypothetical protein AC249_AIPGENE15428 [Exaiptasia diaphana]|nr:hypothetical protein AC249_AIPGENE15428 [Exaiptasia diaphana]
MESTQGDLIKSHSATVLIQENDDVDGESIRSSRCSSIAWSESVATVTKGFGKGDQFRGLKRRSSVENFGQFGFLVPALALCPHADGEVMLPSLRVQPWYFFLFGTYVFVGVFFLTAIVLAIVVDSYCILFSFKWKDQDYSEQLTIQGYTSILNCIPLKPFKTGLHVT